MTENAKIVLDAIITEYNKTHKPIPKHQYLKRFFKKRFSDTDITIICQELVDAKEIIYVPCPDPSVKRSGLSKELVAPASKNIN